MVSSTAPLSSIEACEYHSSKTMPTDARVARIRSRIRSAAHRPATVTSSGPSYSTARSVTYWPW